MPSPSSTPTPDPKATPTPAAGSSRPSAPPSGRLARWAFLGFAAFAFSLSAAVLTWSAFKDHPAPSLQPGELKTLLPTGAEFGWQHEDLPLGNTEALQEASERILNLTDYIYRRYTRGADSFEVYVAYWEPGIMPAREMNQHTPDSCWVVAGWEITERRTATDPQSRTLPGRWRWFEKGGTAINVIFWHLLEGEVYQYGHQSIGQRLSQLVFDPFRYNFQMRREQFLIRISSNQPLEQVWQDPLTSEILARLSFTGLDS